MAQIVLGPVMPEEAEVLQALVKVISADTVLEFGYLGGESSKAMLEALKPEGRLFSCDINDAPKHEDERFTFIHKDMQQITPADFEERTLDLVFFDASHKLSHNLNTLQIIEPYLTNESVIVVHDTGYWNTELFNHQSFGHEFNGRRYHQPEEIEFVENMKKNGYQAITLQTGKVVRHGMSILQKCDI